MLQSYCGQMTLDRNFFERADASSFMVRVQVRSGLAVASCCGSVALSDTDSPQTFTPATAVTQMKACGAVSGMCGCRGDPRSRGGFGAAAPFVTPPLPVLNHFR